MGYWLLECRQILMLWELTATEGSLNIFRKRRDLPSAIEQTKLDVRHYAKRQLTWFRREQGAQWLDGFGEQEDLRDQVFRMFRYSATPQNLTKLATRSPRTPCYPIWSLL